MRIYLPGIWALFSVIASPIAAQVSPSCQLSDSTRLRRWHQMWDGVSDSLLHEIATGRAPYPGGWGPAMSGVITIPDTWAPIHRDSVYGSWQLVAILAARVAGDRHWEGVLRLGPPSRRTKREYRQTEYIRHERMVEGWLVGRDLIKGFDYTDADSIQVFGMFDRSGILQLGAGLWVSDGGGFDVDRVTSGEISGGWYPSGPVIPPYFGWFCGTRLSTSADSTTWRRLLAPAIVEFLRSDSATVPSEIVAREPASQWTQALVLEVHRLLVSELDGRSVDPQRSLELRDPIPPAVQERPDRRVFIEVPFHDARCTAPPGGGQGGYFGATLVARVIETPNGLKADVRYNGNFDGICSTQPQRR